MTTAATDRGSETPDEYADRVEARYRRLLNTGKHDNELVDWLHHRFDGIGPPMSARQIEDIGNGLGLTALVGDIYKSLLAACPPALQTFCEKHVRARGVTSFTIEGAVFASKQGNYCLLVTTALMIFLCKVKKFIFAENDPTVVERCNRYSVDVLSVELIREMRAEIINNFQRGEIRGPMLFLDLERSMPVLLSLGVQERFIVAHEVGHLVSDFLLQGMLTTALHDSFGSSQHRSEYMADLIGFALTRRLPLWGNSDPEDAEPSMIEIGFLSSICEFFEILELGFPNESSSHPSPFDRTCNIIGAFYGDHFGEHYCNWRSGDFPHLDWEARFKEGVRPTKHAQLCKALFAQDGLLQELADLARMQGPEHLKRMAAGFLVQSHLDDAEPGANAD